MPLGRTQILKLINGLLETSGDRPTPDDVLRDATVSALTEYGALIESSRVALFRVLDVLRSESQVAENEDELQARIDVTLALGRADIPGPGEADSKTISVDPLVTAAADYAHSRLLAWSELLPPALAVGAHAADTDRHFAHDEFLGRVAEACEEHEAFRGAALELDKAWADVRPLLDDALSFGAVKVMRVIRHDLRDDLAPLNSRVRSWIRAEASDPGDLARRRERAERLAHEIRRVLEKLDVWSAQVAAIRRSLRS